MTTTPRPRVDAGVPTGGEFKAYVHSDQGLPTLSGLHASEGSPRYVPESLRMARIPATVVTEAAAEDAKLHPCGQLKGGYVPPAADVRQGDQGTLTTGSKYTGYRDASEICKDIRADLKEATEAGYLPAGLSYSVRGEKFSGWQTVRVSIQGVSDADREHPTEVDHMGAPKNRPEADELLARVGAITGAYTRIETDAVSGDFSETYYGLVRLESDSGRKWREAEAADRKAKAAARAAGK